MFYKTKFLTRESDTIQFETKTTVKQVVQRLIVTFMFAMEAECMLHGSSPASPVGTIPTPNCKVLMYFEEDGGENPVLVAAADFRYAVGSTAIAVTLTRLYV